VNRKLKQVAVELPDGFLEIWVLGN
jgi:hypothetical protein